MGAVLAAVALTVGLAACGTQSVPGKPRALGQIDVGTVAGLPVNDKPSGLRPGIAEARLDVENLAPDGEQQGHEMDVLAVDALADVYKFWEQTMPTTFDGQEFNPPKRLVSYDSGADGPEICGVQTRGLVNAMYCTKDDSVSWDRGDLLPMFAKNPDYGPMSVVVILAHEMGHKIQYSLGDKSKITDRTPTIVKEQQADCYAGAFFRWVAEDKAPHFTVSTGDGLNRVLSSILSIRDPVGEADSDHPSAHGLAFDRMFAFQAGFTDGAARCAKIDMAEVDKRLTERKFTEADKNEGNVDVDDTTLKLTQISLDEAFKNVGAQLPKIVDNGGRCKDGKQTSPATYCQDDNTIGIDKAKLAEIGKPPGRGKAPEPGASGIGDFAAFAEIASRYSLSMQHSRGLPLTGPIAGLRTACLTGAWSSFTRNRTDDNPENKLRLSVGDLDEAMAELLSDHGLIAADVDGVPVPAGFARVEAFRTGYVEGSGSCTSDFVG